MEDSFVEISNDDSLMMKKDCMMNILSSTAVKVDSFAEHLEFMFTEKTSNHYCSN